MVKAAKASSIHNILCFNPLCKLGNCVQNGSYSINQLTRSGPPTPALVDAKQLGFGQRANTAGKLPWPAIIMLVRCEQTLVL